MRVVGGVRERGSGAGAGAGSAARGVVTRNIWALEGGCGGAEGTRMMVGASPLGVLGVATRSICGVPLLEMSSPGSRMIVGLEGRMGPGEATRKVAWLRGAREPGIWITLGEVCPKFVKTCLKIRLGSLTLILSPSWMVGNAS